LGFTLLGIASYYAATFISGEIVELFFFNNESHAFEPGQSFLRMLFTIPFGLLAAYIFYEKLESHWRRNPKKTKADKTHDEDIINRL